MSVTNSTFSDLKTVSYNDIAIGNVTNVKIAKKLKRVEAQNGGVVSGPISSHVVERNYTLSFDSTDISAYASLFTVVQGHTLSVFTGVWIASETQAGTPMPNQQITLSQCIMDDINQSPEMKALGKYTVTAHTMATSDDSDAYTIADA